MQVISIACLSLFSIFSKHPCTGASLRNERYRERRGRREREQWTTVIRKTTHCTQLSCWEFLQRFKKSYSPNWTFPPFCSIFLFSFVLLYRLMTLNSPLPLYPSIRPPFPPRTLSLVSLSPSLFSFFLTPFPLSLYPPLPPSSCFPLLPSSCSPLFPSSCSPLPPSCCFPLLPSRCSPLLPSSCSL